MRTEIEIVSIFVSNRPPSKLVRIFPSFFFVVVLRVETATVEMCVVRTDQRTISGGPWCSGRFDAMDESLTSCELLERERIEYRSAVPIS